MTDDGFPLHTYVPGGPFGRPVREMEPRETLPISGRDWRVSREYAQGMRLFNAGFYWEAHEVWEAIWHAENRRGPVADLLKGLIKLAACGVKVREGQIHGVLTHAERAFHSFERAEAAGGPVIAGLRLDELKRRAEEISRHPPRLDFDRAAPVVVVFPFSIEPDRATVER